MAYYTSEELINIGLKTFGNNVFISNKCSIYNAQNITIGDNVRIDDFCVLSAGDGGIQIGSFIHIAVYSCLIGKGLIKLSDFCNISSRVSIYSSNDDYSGSFMTNPMVDMKFTNVKNESVYIGKHVIIGSGCVILPGSDLQDGCGIGALSLVSGQIPKLDIFAGTPAKYIKKRKENIFEIEKQNFK